MYNTQKTVAKANVHIKIIVSGHKALLRLQDVCIHKQLEASIMSKM